MQDHSTTNPPLCACGCGQPVTRSKKHPDTRFVRGHHPAHVMTTYNLICPVCQRPFSVRRSSKNPPRYCSFACSRKGIAKSGPDNPLWKGGRSVTFNGYIVLRVDGRYRYEHRYIMEQLIGRPLARQEAVHHINGDKMDNRPENLQLFSNAAHTSLELQKSWQNGTRHHPPDMNAHLKKGQVLNCPICGTEHYEKLSRLERPCIRFCEAHRGRGKRPDLAGQSISCRHASKVAPGQDVS